MKFNCGPSERQRKQNARDRWCRWHRWFAWFPVRIGENDCRWLEHVERQADGIHGAGLIFEWTPYDFKYRALTN